MPELTLHNLCVAHVGPVNLQVKAGEIVCLSGASGSGKSLLLRAIADIIPHTGTVLLDAQETELVITTKAAVEEARTPEPVQS